MRELNSKSLQSQDVELLHHERQALAVAVETPARTCTGFGPRRLVLAAKLDAGRILEDVGALGQVINEEMAGDITGALVVGQAILIFVARDTFTARCRCRAGLSGARIPYPVHPQLDANHQFVANVERAFDRLSTGPFGGVHLGIERLVQLQRGAFIRRDFADVFEVLPVHATPRHAGVHLLNRDLAQLRLII